MVYLFGKSDGSDLEQRWGRVVTGEVVMDGKQHYKPGDRLCTTPVLRSLGNLVHTRTGEVYTLFGEGLTIELPVTVLPQLLAMESVKTLAHSVAHWRD